MNAPSSHTYTFTDAIISPKSATVNVSQWYSNIMNLYTSKANRLNRKIKWIQLTKNLVTKKFKDKLISERKTVSKYVFVDATKIIWRKLSKKLLFRSRIFVIKYYYAQLLKVNYERHVNIKIQWKTYSYALLHGFESPKHSYRELWRSYAFLINKKRVIEMNKVFRKLPFHGTEEARQIWKRFSMHAISRYHIIQMKKYVKAVAVLTRFFNRSLVSFRAKKTAESVASFNADYSFTKPFVAQSCNEVNRFVKRFLSRRANDFSHAYADETFKTSFVHVLGSVRTHNSP